MLYICYIIKWKHVLEMYIYQTFAMCQELDIIKFEKKNGIKKIEVSH